MGTQSQYVQVLRLHTVKRFSAQKLFYVARYLPLIALAQ